MLIKRIRLVRRLVVDRGYARFGRGGECIE